MRTLSGFCEEGTRWRFLASVWIVAPLQGAPAWPGRLCTTDWRSWFHSNPAKSNYQRTTVSGHPTKGEALFSIVGCPLTVVR